MVRRSLICAVMLGVTLLVAGCINPGKIPTEPQPLPEVVVQQFIRALAADDRAKAMALVDDGQAQTQATGQAIASVSEAWSANGGSGRVMGVKVSGDDAVVAVMCMTDTGAFTSNLTPVFLHKYNGLWRIAAEVTNPSPSARPVDAKVLKGWYEKKVADLSQVVPEPS